MPKKNMLWPNPFPRYVYEQIPYNENLNNAIPFALNNSYLDTVNDIPMLPETYDGDVWGIQTSLYLNNSINTKPNKLGE